MRRAGFLNVLERLPVIIDRFKWMPDNECVSERRTSVSWLWRLLGSFTVALWVSAFTLCTAHCSLPESSLFEAANAESVMPCHGSPSCPTSDTQSAGAFCIMVRDLFAGDVQAFAVYPPEVPDLPAQFLVQALPDLSNSRGDSSSCDAARDDRPFTPEVSLGPAFRAHAPPLI